MELEQIMQRIRSGDRDALRTLIAQYGGGVYQRALRKTGDKALAKEITQKTFAQLVTTLQDKEGEDGWQLWLDSLAAHSIDASVRQRSDISYMADELDRELSEQPQQQRQQPQQPRRQQGGARPDWTYNASQQPRMQQGDARTYNAPRPPYAPQPQTRRPASAQNRNTRDLPPRTEGVRTTAGLDFEPQQKHGAGYGFGVFVLVLLCAALVWVAAGVLMSMGILPVYDLGYSWFNANVFKIF